MSRRCILWLLLLKRTYFMAEMMHRSLSCHIPADAFCDCCCFCYWFSLAGMVQAIVWAPFNASPLYTPPSQNSHLGQESSTSTVVVPWPRTMHLPITLSHGKKFEENEQNLQMHWNASGNNNSRSTSERSWGERTRICRRTKTRQGTTTVEVLLRAHGEKFKEKGKESADALKRVEEQQQ